jgi:hypothetical protein
VGLVAWFKETETVHHRGTEITEIEIGTRELRMRSPKKEMDAFHLFLRDLCVSVVILFLDLAG